jgi:hypothetical protein
MAAAGRAGADKWIIPTRRIPNGTYMVVGQLGPDSFLRQVKIVR